MRSRPLRSVQESPQGLIIRVDDDVYRMLSRRRGPGQSFNDVLRRQFGLPWRAKWMRRPRHAPR
jgi:negative regulator of replication initiation